MPIYEGCGEKAHSKMTKVCESCKVVLNKLRTVFTKISGSPLNILKKKIAMVQKTYGDIKVVSKESVTIQEKCFKLLRLFLVKAKEYVQKVKDSKGWEKGITILEILSLPIPIPGLTAAIYGLHTGLKMLEKYINTFKDRKIDNAIVALENVNFSVEQSNNSDIVATGYKLVDKLRQCLNIATSQVNKLYSTLQSNVNKRGK